MSRAGILVLTTLALACGGREPTPMPMSRAPDPVPADATRPPPDRQPPDRPPPDRHHCVAIDEIAIYDRFEFAQGSATLDPGARPIVDALVQTLNAYPMVERLGVVGGRSANEPEALAVRRAEGVAKTLVDRGVAASRLEPHGIAAATTREVWFVMLRVTGHHLDPPAAGRWAPPGKDCAASWRAWQEHGTTLDCDCLDKRPAP